MSGALSCPLSVNTGCLKWEKQWFVRRYLNTVDILCINGISLCQKHANLNQISSKTDLTFCCSEALVLEPRGKQWKGQKKSFTMLSWVLPSIFTGWQTHFILRGNKHFTKMDWGSRWHIHFPSFLPEQHLSLNLTEAFFASDAHRAKRRGSGKKVSTLRHLDA